MLSSLIHTLSCSTALITSATLITQLIASTHQLVKVSASSVTNLPVIKHRITIDKQIQTDLQEEPPKKQEPITTEDKSVFTDNFELHDKFETNHVIDNSNVSSDNEDDEEGYRTPGKMEENYQFLTPYTIENSKIIYEWNENENEVIDNESYFKSQQGIVTKHQNDYAVIASVNFYADEVSK